MNCNFIFRKCTKIFWKKYLHQMQSTDLNLMRVLDAVLSCGSVTAAAQRLHLSVPATSHALARLRVAQRWEAPVERNLYEWRWMEAANASVPGIAPRVQHLRQAVDGLRAEHQIDIGCALGNRRTLLAGDTAADTDQHIGAGLLQFAHATEIGKHLFLGFFPHRAGVEQDQIGLGRVVGALVALLQAEQLDHAV